MPLSLSIPVKPLPSKSVRSNVPLDLQTCKERERAEEERDPRREERGERECRERSPRASPRDGSNFRREGSRERGECVREERRRGRARERDGGERGSLLALLCDGIFFRRERERKGEER